MAEPSLPVKERQLFFREAFCHQRVVTVTKVTLLLTLSLCFLFQVRSQFLKYVKGDTTLTSNSVSVGSLEFPVIMICSDVGFKYDILARSGFPPELWLQNQLASEGTSMEVEAALSKAFKGSSVGKLDSLMTNTTYRLEELVSGIKMQHQGEIQTLSISDIQKQDFISIQEVWSSYMGACYLLKINKPVRSETDFVTLVLSYPEKTDSINVFLFNHTAESYLAIFGYWVIQPIMLEVRKQVTSASEMTVQYIKRNHNKRNCEPNGDLKRHHECIARHMIQTCKPCQFPVFKHLLSTNSTATFDNCQSPAQVATIHNCLEEEITAAILHRCPGPCNQWKYEIATRKVPIQGRPSNMSRVSLYFERMEVEEREEYLLLDFTAILAAVGGSMGMFLGFSFLSAGSAILKRMELALTPRRGSV